MKKKTIDQQIGERLKDLRQAMHLEEDNMAKMLEISSKQLHQYEQGQASMNISFLVNLSSVFSVPMSYFFEGLSCYKLDMNILYSEQTQNLLAAYYQISNREVADNVYKLVLSLAEN